MEIKDLNKPVKLTVNVESGKLMHAFLFETLKNDTDTDKMFNVWIKNYVGLSTGTKDLDELFAEYFMSNANKIITKTDLRGLSLVNGNKFKAIFDKLLDDIISILNANGYSLERVPINNGYMGFKCIQKGV